MLLRAFLMEVMMKVSKLVGQRFKEKPADCVIDSHALMIRGGYMKYVGNGIYSEFPTLKRITAKIEAIIRKEMNMNCFFLHCVVDIFVKC